MAELPEVETIRRQLSAEAVGLRWEKVTAVPFSVLRTPAREIGARLAGARLEKVERRGKVLMACFDNSSALLVHLGMSGQILLAPPADPPQTHRYLHVKLEDGRELVFRDPRRFGFCRLVPSAELDSTVELARLGVDPLEASFTWDRFSARVKEKTQTVKAMLMDQKMFAGIGNIYGDEILFTARVLPSRSSADVSAAALKDLYHAIRGVLTTACEYGGTSFDEAYVDLYGRPGLFGGWLKVYGRNGEPCGQCHTQLKSFRTGGRTTVYCPHCQK